jgi:hypothetical protein
MTVGDCTCSMIVMQFNAENDRNAYYIGDARFTLFEYNSGFTLSLALYFLYICTV